MAAPRNSVVCKDPSSLAQSVAERIEAMAAKAESKPVTVALSGGSTPKRLYETMAAAPFRDRVRWDRLEFFFGDERSVAPEHPDSNYGMAKRALLDQIPSRSHRMVAENGEAEAYERLVRERVSETRDGIPSFDLILLGIGTDGHTASLFPGTGALGETRRLVVMNEVPQMKTRRMTFTYPLLNAARHVWILACGADKQEILGKCFSAKSESEYPILGVHPAHGELVWWFDEASSAKLEVKGSQR